MANRYRFATKKKLGYISKTDDTVYADNIQGAIFKMLDNIDPNWVDKNKQYIESKISEQITEKSYTLFTCEYNGKQIESFIEQIDGTRIMN